MKYELDIDNSTCWIKLHKRYHQKCQKHLTCHLTEYINEDTLWWDLSEQLEDNLRLPGDIIDRMLYRKVEAEYFVK